MTPEQFKAARIACGLSLAEWAIALGYRVKDRDGMRTLAADMESGRKALTPQVARLAYMFARYGIPKQFKQQAE